MFFKHFASKNQLLGFYISGTLVENGLKKKSWEKNSGNLKIPQNMLFTLPCRIIGMGGSLDLLILSQKNATKIMTMK